MKLEWVDETKFFSEEEQSEPEQRVAGAMVRLLVTAGNFDCKFDGKTQSSKFLRCS